MILLEISATVAVDPALATPALPGFVSIETAPLLEAEVEMVPGIAAQLNPRNGTVQAAALGARTIVAPAAVELNEATVSSMRADDTLGNRTGFGLTLPASKDDWTRGPLGYEVDHGAPPPGLAPVDVFIEYQTAAGFRVEYPFTTNAKAQESERVISRTDGHGLAIQGLDASSRFDRKKVSLSLPPRHGLTHGRLIRALLILAGIPASSIAVPADFGVPLQRALDVTKEEVWSVVAEIAHARGCFVGTDQAGRFQVFDGSPTSTRRWTFTPDQLSATGTDLRIRYSAEVPTCIVFNGEAPELPDDSDGTLGSTEVVEVVAPFEVPGALFQQNSDGSLTAFPGNLPEKEMLVSRITTIRRERHGCLLEEEVITEGWFAPEAARYTINADGSLVARSGVFVYEAGATPFDGAPAYFWSNQKFVVVSRVLTRRFYAEPGTDIPQLQVVNIEGSAHVMASWGELVQVETITNGWFNPRRALKNRPDTSTPWEDVDFLTGIGAYVTGPGEGVFFTEERYYAGENPAGMNLAQRALHVETTDTRNKNGYVSREEIGAVGFIIPKGRLYQYQGEETSDFDTSQQKTEKTTSKVYSSRNSGGSSIVTTELGPDKKLIQQTRESRVGSAPAAERCSEEDAQRRTGRPFTVRFCRNSDQFDEFEEEASNDFVEDEAQARFYCEKELRRRQAGSVDIAVPVNAAVKKGDPVFVSLQVAGIMREGWVEAVKIEKARRRESILSLFTVKLHPFP